MTQPKTPAELAEEIKRLADRYAARRVDAFNSTFGWNDESQRAKSAVIDLHASIDRLRSMTESAQQADHEIGKWLSAALDDPQACDEFKQDIRNWFDSRPRD